MTVTEQVYKSKSATFQHPSLSFLSCSVFVVAVYIVAICKPNMLKEEKLKNVYPRKCSDVPVSVKLLLSFEYCILPFVMLDCPSAFLFTRILIHQG